MVGLAFAGVATGTLGGDADGLLLPANGEAGPANCNPAATVLKIDCVPL